MMSYLPLNEYSSALSKQTRAVASLQPLLGELLSLPATQRRDIDWGRVQWLAENPVSLPHGIQLGMTSVADQIAAIAAERYEIRAVWYRCQHSRLAGLRAGQGGAT